MHSPKLLPQRLVGIFTPRRPDCRLPERFQSLNISRQPCQPTSDWSTEERTHSILDSALGKSTPDPLHQHLFLFASPVLLASSTPPRDSCPARRASYRLTDLSRHRPTIVCAHFAQLCSPELTLQDDTPNDVLKDMAGHYKFDSVVAELRPVISAHVSRCTAVAGTTILASVASLGSLTVASDGLLSTTPINSNYTRDCLPRETLALKCRSYSTSPTTSRSS